MKTILSTVLLTTPLAIRFDNDNVAPRPTSHTLKLFRKPAADPSSELQLTSGVKHTAAMQSRLRARAKAKSARASELEEF